MTLLGARARAWAWGLALLLATPAAAADTAWINSEIRLNLRTGPSGQHRILGVVKTGDRVDILQRREKWTQVRLEDGRQGWIPGGYLNPEPPPLQKLAMLEAETVDLRRKLESVSEQKSVLETSSEASIERETTQRAEIERLAQENLELRAGARWPHWIAGASILAAGMVIGAILSRLGGRRAARRIRL